MDLHETPVLFRASRTKEPEITAVFPCEPAGYYNPDMTCYAHIGQHGACSMGWYYTTRPATPEEYLSLQEELESEGYRLKIYKRIQPWMRQALREEQERLGMRYERYYKIVVDTKQNQPLAKRYAKP